MIGAAPEGFRHALFWSGVVLVSILPACASMSSSGQGDVPPEERYRASITSLEEGNFERASQNLRRLSASCESGEWGERAVLLLAAVEMDPRNPRRNTGVAAILAARYLQIPAAPPGSKVLARSLYLAALDLGARPVEDPFGPVPRPAGGDGPERASTTGYWRVADRFDSCYAVDDDAPAPELSSLPRHPGQSLSLLHRRTVAERDSLAAEMERLSAAGDSLRVRMTDRERELEMRVDSLAMELERIRGLLESGLGVPDDSPDPP